MAITDNYNRASLGTTTDTGETYENLGGNWAISASTVLTTNPTRTAGDALVVNTGVTDYTVSANVTGQYPSVVGRVADKNNNIVALWNTTPTSARLYRIVAGIGTQLGANGTITPVSGDAIGLDCQGTTLRFLVNGAESRSVTDSTYTTQTKAGLRGDTTAATWDNLSLVYGPTAAVPDAVTDLAGTAGDSEVNLAWSPPASDGGSAVIDYKVYYRVVG